MFNTPDPFKAHKPKRYSATRDQPWSIMDLYHFNDNVKILTNKGTDLNTKIQLARYQKDFSRREELERELEETMRLLQEFNENIPRAEADIAAAAATAAAAAAAAAAATFVA